MAHTHQFVTVYMPIELVERIAEICAEEDRTKSNFIKRCVEQAIRERIYPTLSSPHRAITNAPVLPPADQDPTDPATSS